MNRFFIRFICTFLIISSTSSTAASLCRLEIEKPKVMQPFETIQDASCSPYLHELEEGNVEEENEEGYDKCPFEGKLAVGCLSVTSILFISGGVMWATCHNPEDDCEQIGKVGESMVGLGVILFLAQGCILSNILH